jgi:hypothetical protein
VFKRKQRGKIGLALNGDWYEAKPAADLGEQRRNEKAAERALEFTLGWFARPVYQVGFGVSVLHRAGFSGLVVCACRPRKGAASGLVPPCSLQDNDLSNTHKALPMPAGTQNTDLAAFAAAAAAAVTSASCSLTIPA